MLTLEFKSDMNNSKSLVLYVPDWICYIRDFYSLFCINTIDRDSSFEGVLSSLSIILL